MAAKITTFGHISAYETYRGLILVSIPMFSGSMNPVRPVYKTLTPFRNKRPEFQDGRQEISILGPSLFYSINHDFLVLHIEGFQTYLGDRYKSHYFCLRVRFSKWPPKLVETRDKVFPYIISRPDANNLDMNASRVMW